MLSTARLSRSSLALLGLFLLAIVAGCPDSVAPPQPFTGESIDDLDDIRRFYPMAEGSIWRYNASGDVTFEYEIVEMGEKNGGPTATLFVTVEGSGYDEYMRWSGENLLSSVSGDFTSESKELDGPFYEGARWRKTDQSSGDYVFYIDSEILDLHYPVSVPAGEFESLLVREVRYTFNPVSGESSDTTYVYFVQDYGIVKWDIAGLLYELTDYLPGEGENGDE